MYIFRSLILLWSYTLASTIPAAPKPATVLLSAYDQFTQFARAAYCPGRKLRDWKCGEACKALSDFEPTLVGGDGTIVQTYFVGYWPSQHSVVVAHQGTDPLVLIPILTDVNIILAPLNQKLFPGTPSVLRVHAGFVSAHAQTAADVLAEVKRLMRVKKTENVLVTGHSLGGALAMLDALFLSIHLRDNAKIKSAVYGTPRVGNPAFAHYFDAKAPDIHRINNMKDVIPTIPPRSLGYLHPAGEIHILRPGFAVQCFGDDNDVDSECQARTVPNLLFGSVIDHLGPYDGINISTLSCV